MNRLRQFKLTAVVFLLLILSAQVIAQAPTKIYWVDSGTDKIQRANLDGSNVEDVISTGLKNPQGIAIDFLAGKMYWTDLDPGTDDKIQRANLDGNNIEDLVTTGIDKPYGIALDLTAGKMYWTDWQIDRIQRSNLDGSNIENLVTTGIPNPNHLVLDLTRGKM